jgi:hypothetical protein
MIAKSPRPSWGQHMGPGISRQSLSRIAKACQTPREEIIRRKGLPFFKHVSLTNVLNSKRYKHDFLVSHLVPPT